MKPAALWYLESINLYKLLCPVKLQADMGQHTYLNYKKNDYIYFESQDADSIFFVAKGRVKIFYRTPHKEEVVKSILSSGEIFGELALAEEKTRSDFAQAMDNDTLICVWKLADLKNLLLEDKELSFKVVKLMGLKLFKMQRKVDLLIFKDTRTRVVEFLKDAAEWKGKKVGAEMLIMTPLTHGDIAKLIGLSRQSVSTILNDLKAENQIYFDRRRILIRNLPTLA
ncbi:MAG: Crp/Fnr family transcriptional regulator [Cyclobacteriaceae bacterium]|nr:Crp/Fnr family transcriptional regulator [Cyclobacteriaceae bacterium]